MTHKKPIAKKPLPPPPKKISKASAWDRIENFLQQHQTPVAGTLIALFVLFALLLFDFRVSIWGDDSGYIERGYNFIHHGEITFYQGPLYPAVLGIFIGIFGINITALKLTSFLFMLMQVVILFLALRKRIPHLILFLLLLFIATNYFIQNYSSQTYTEAFFMFLQAASFYFIFKLIDREEENVSPKKNYKLWIVTGLMMLLLSLAKSIAIVCFIPLIIYFLVKRKWIHALLSFGSFLLWKIIYELSMRLFYHAPDMGQFKQILLKDLYKPALGYETIPGLITRFNDNLHTYFSEHIFRFLGLQSEFNYEKTMILAFPVALLLIACTVYLFKKNKYLFFTAIYMLILYGGIFIGIQANNKQDRLIIILLPVTYLVVTGAGYYVSRSYRKAGIAVSLFFVILLFVQLNNTVTVCDQHYHVLKKGLKKDIYYGFTDDWKNYLQLSRWCADSLPKESLVACRKGGMAFVYSGGKSFYEINIVECTDPDTVLAVLKQNKVTHFILANLRQNAFTNDGTFITTLHKKFFPIYQKYPEKIKLIKSIGTSEPADLYQILY